jgi:hypothetical protein
MLDRVLFYHNPPFRFHPWHSYILTFIGVGGEFFTAHLQVNTPVPRFQLNHQLVSSPLSAKAARTFKLLHHTLHLICLNPTPYPRKPKTVAPTHISAPPPRPHSSCRQPMIKLRAFIVRAPVSRDRDVPYSTYSVKPLKGRYQSNARRSRYPPTGVTASAAPVASDRKSARQPSNPFCPSPESILPVAQRQARTRKTSTDT